MAGIVRVRIIMPKLLANLRTFDPNVTPDDVMEFLADNDVSYAGGSVFESDDASLELLDESELSAVAS